MNTHQPKTTAEKGKAIAHDLQQKPGAGGDALGYADGRPEGHLAAMASGSVQMKKLGAVQRMANGGDAPIQMVAKFAGAATVANIVNVRLWFEEVVRDNAAPYFKQAQGFLDEIKQKAAGIPEMKLAMMVNIINAAIDKANPPAAPQAPVVGAAAAGGQAQPAALNAPAQAPAPAAQPKTQNEVIAKLKQEIAIRLQSNAVQFNTGYNGRGGANETVTEATRAALQAMWNNTNKATFGITDKDMDLHYAWSHGLVNQNGFDFVIKEKAGGKGIFNFHILVV